MKETITLQQLTHLAELARLTLGEAELERTRLQLETILDYMKALDSLPETGLAPSPVGGDALRADLRQPSYPSEELLQNAPAAKDSMFKVPQTVE